MDDSTKRILQRLIRRIPYQMLQTVLGKWAHLSREDLHSLDFTQPKWVLTERLLALCEEKGLTVKHITELEMIYIIENPNQGMWHGFQLLDAEEDAPSIELTQFKEQFKANLTELISHVSIKIKKHTDEAIWIRVAWGDNFTKPNHLKPTYVVHHLQTPYVFVTGVTSKHKPLLNQALVLATRYGSMKDAHLSGRNLIAIRDLLMRQYQQVFPTKHPKPLQEKNPVPRNPNIEKEQAENTENRLQMACEAFGDGTLPQLQKAVYKLETKFRDNSNKTLTGRGEPFRGVVEFASTNLLESLRHCVSSGGRGTMTDFIVSISFSRWMC
ncbi:centromere protein N-B isoform X2 [Salmo trutta]|uniref:centromere protein N-B isoform X2 n=1 Tax=Salmo trutta TaxID=8032 RepID=UPI0011315E94|nr:centromere protein N isoform X2 [Salmo trutta]